MSSHGPFDRGQGGAITSVEAFVLAVMTAILVAISIPSYVAMRNRANDGQARSHLRQAADAAEAYRIEHGSYAGLSPAGLRRLDAELQPSRFRLEIVRADGYCVEATSGDRTWHLTAPARDVARGGC